VEDFSANLPNPKTKELAAALLRWGIQKTEKVLLILAVVPEPIYLSARNIPNVKLTRADSLNVYDVVNADKIVITSEAIKIVQQIYDQNLDKSEKIKVLEQIHQENPQDKIMPKNGILNYTFHLSDNPHIFDQDNPKQSFSTGTNDETKLNPQDIAHYYLKKVLSTQAPLSQPQGGEWSFKPIETIKAPFTNATVVKFR
jgi:hypothetical protein